MRLNNLWLTGCFLLVLLSSPMPALSQTSVTAIALFKDRAMLSVNGEKAKIIRTGNQLKGVKLISSNTSEAVIEMNGKRQVLTLNSSATVSDELGSFDPSVQAVVEIRVNRFGFFESKGSVNGKRVDFLVDTGANIVVLSSADANRIGFEYKDGVRSLASTASGTAPMYAVKAREVSLGAIKISNVQVGVIEGVFPEKPLLGMTFLSKVDMNRSGNLMTLKER